MTELGLAQPQLVSVTSHFLIMVLSGSFSLHNLKLKMNMKLIWVSVELGNSFGLFQVSQVTFAFTTRLDFGQKVLFWIMGWPAFWPAIREVDDRTRTAKLGLGLGLGLSIKK